MTAGGGGAWGYVMRGGALLPSTPLECKGWDPAQDLRDQASNSHTCPHSLTLAHPTSNVKALLSRGNHYRQACVSAWIRHAVGAAHASSAHV